MVGIQFLDQLLQSAAVVVERLVLRERRVVRVVVAHMVIHMEQVLPDKDIAGETIITQEIIMEPAAEEEPERLEIRAHQQAAEPAELVYQAV
jgi:hypothetical protein